MSSFSTLFAVLLLAGSALASTECFVENGVAWITNVPSGVGCIKRSDISQIDLSPAAGLLIYGAQVIPSNLALSIRLYEDKACTEALGAVIHCTTLPSTYCDINQSGELYLENVPAIAQCIKRGDIAGEKAVATGAPHEFTFPSKAEYCGIEIHFFADAACTNQLQAQTDVFCTCGRPTPTPTPTHTATCAPVTITKTVTVHATPAVY